MMMTTELDAIAARVAVLSIVVQEIGRVLTPAQSGQVARALRHRVAGLSEPNLAAACDEAIVTELVPLLKILKSA